LATGDRSGFISSIQKEGKTIGRRREGSSELATYETKSGVEGENGEYGAILMKNASITGDVKFVEREVVGESQG